MDWAGDCCRRIDGCSAGVRGSRDSGSGTSNRSVGRGIESVQDVNHVSARRKYVVTCVISIEEGGCDIGYHCGCESRECVERSSVGVGVAIGLT